VTNVRDPSSPPFRKSPRIPGFDYASAGTYFLTICTRNMACRFGELRNGEMYLNDAGEMVACLWERNQERYRGAEVDAYIVMPNHLHGILMIGTDPGCEQPSATAYVQSFKSMTTIEYGRGVRGGRYPPYDTALWQRSFHDRILRSE
jgi:REP element-mobilizing transposase RayT